MEESDVPCNLISMNGMTWRAIHQEDVTRDHYPKRGISPWIWVNSGCPSQTSWNCVWWNQSNTTETSGTLAVLRVSTATFSCMPRSRWHSGLLAKYSKATKPWYSSPVKVPKDYTYIATLLQQIVQAREAMPSFLSCCYSNRCDPGKLCHVVVDDIPNESEQLIWDISWPTWVGVWTYLHKNNSGLFTAWAIV